VSFDIFPRALCNILNSTISALVHWLGPLDLGVEILFKLSSISQAFSKAVRFVEALKKTGFQQQKS